MKTKIICTALTAAMLASATIPTAFARFYPTKELFEATDYELSSSNPSTSRDDRVWKWLDNGDTFKYNAVGVDIGSEVWKQYSYNANNFESLFEAGWNPTDIQQEQSIFLAIGKDDVIGDFESFKNAKYADSNRNVADMCEWNGYLFALMNSENYVKTEDGKYVVTNQIMYLNPELYPDQQIYFAAQQDNGAYAQTDVNGKYIVDDAGEKITVTGAFNQYVMKNSSQIQVYDISNGGKEMVADLDCQNNLGINTDTRTGADYLTIGIDVDDDYIYCYVAPKGYTNYAVDRTRNLGLTVFKNTIGKSRDDANFETFERHHLNGELYDMNLLAPEGAAEVNLNYNDGFRHSIIGNKILTFTNMQQSYNGEGQNGRYVTITDISDIDNGNITNTNYKWEDWLKFSIPSNHPGYGSVSTNPIYLREFKIQGNFGYALIQYKNSNGTWDNLIKKYDISDLSKPKEKTESEHLVTPGRQVTNRVYVEDDYVYVAYSQDESVSLATREDFNPIIKVYDADSLNTVNTIEPLKTKGARNPSNVLYQALHISTIGDYLYVVFVGDNGFNKFCEYFIKLSDDKTTIVDSYATADRIASVTGQSLFYGNKLYTASGNLPGYASWAPPFWCSKINVMDMSKAYPVDLKLDQIPQTVEAPYTITGRLAGASDTGNIVQVVVNNNEPVYITDADIEYADNMYSTRLNFTIEEPGEYTVTITPFDQLGYLVDKASETVSFTVKSATVPEEFKLSAEYSSKEIGEGKFTVIPKVTNNVKQGEVKGTPVAALYNGSKLVSVKVGTEQTIAEGAYLQELGTLELTVPSDIDYSQYNVKVFLFDSLKTIKPLTENVSLKK